MVIHQKGTLMARSSALTSLSVLSPVVFVSSG
jgi:hypothetical protein